MNKNNSSEAKDFYSKVYKQMPLDQLIDAKSFVMLAWKTGLVEELVRKELSEASEPVAEITTLVEQIRYRIAKSWHAFRDHERLDAPSEVAGKLPRKVLGATVVAKKFPDRLIGEQAFKFMKDFRGRPAYLFRTLKEEKTFHDELLESLRREKPRQSFKPTAAKQANLNPSKTAVLDEKALDSAIANELRRTKKTKQELASRVDKLATEKEAVLKKLDLYRANNKHLDKRMFDFVEENQRLKYELRLEQKNNDELSERLAACHQKCAELERRLSDATASQRTQTMVAGGHEAAISEMERRHAIVTEEAQALKLRLQESESIITRLKRECLLLRKNNQRLEDQATDYGAIGVADLKKRAKLKLRNAEIEAEVAALREERTGKLSELRDLQAKKRETRAELKTLRSEHADNLKALKTERTKHKKALTGKGALVADNKVLRRKVERLEADLACSSQTLLELEKQLSAEKTKKLDPFFGFFMHGKKKANSPRRR